MGTCTLLILYWPGDHPRRVPHLLLPLRHRGGGHPDRGALLHPAARGLLQRRHRSHHRGDARRRAVGRLRGRPRRRASRPVLLGRRLAGNFYWPRESHREPSATPRLREPQKEPLLTIGLRGTHPVGWVHLPIAPWPRPTRLQVGSGFSPASPRRKLWVCRPVSSAGFRAARY